MRIVFLTDSIDTTSAGIGRLALGLLEQLHVRGHELILVDIREKTFLSRFASKWVVIPPRVGFLKMGIWHLDVIKRLERANLGAIDGILNPSALPNIFGDLKKVLWISYDLSEIRHPSTFQRAALRYLFARIFIPWCVRRVGSVAAISSFTKLELTTLFDLSPSEVTVCYPGPSPTFLPTETSPESRSSLTTDGPYFLFVGTIQPRKNVKRLLQAFEVVRGKVDKRVRLVLAGGYGWKSDDVRAAIAESKFKNDIEVLGYVADSALRALYESAVALVYPSYYEGFGLPVLDAMTYRCPVIVSSGTVMEEIAGDAALLVDSLSVESITFGMLELLSSPARRHDLIEKGARRSQEFSWPNCAKLIEDQFVTKLSANLPKADCTRFNQGMVS